MKKTLLLAGFAGMIAANANAIDATPYVGLDVNFAMTDADTTLSKAGVLDDSVYSLSGVLGARTERFGLEYFYNNLKNKKLFPSSVISVMLDIFFKVR